MHAVVKDMLSVFKKDVNVAQLVSEIQPQLSRLIDEILIGHSCLGNALLGEVLLFASLKQQTEGKKLMLSYLDAYRTMEPMMAQLLNVGLRRVPHLSP